MHPTATLPPPRGAQRSPAHLWVMGSPCAARSGAFQAPKFCFFGVPGAATPQQSLRHPSPAEGLQVPAVPGQTGIWEPGGCSPQPRVEQGGWGLRVPTLGCCSHPHCQPPMPPSCSCSPLPTAQHISEPGRPHGAPRPHGEPRPHGAPRPHRAPICSLPLSVPPAPSQPFPALVVLFTPHFQAASPPPAPSSAAPSTSPALTPPSLGFLRRPPHPVPGRGTPWLSSEHSAPCRMRPVGCGCRGGQGGVSGAAVITAGATSGPREQTAWANGMSQAPPSLAP